MLLLAREKGAQSVVPYLLTHDVNGLRFTGGFVPVVIVLEFSNKQEVADPEEDSDKQEILAEAAADFGLEFLKMTAGNLRSNVRRMNRMVRLVAGQSFMVLNSQNTVQSCVDFETILGFAPGLVIVLTTSESELEQKLRDEGALETVIRQANERFVAFEQSMVGIQAHVGKVKYHEVSIDQSDDDILDEIKKIIKPWLEEDTMFSRLMRDQAAADRREAALAAVTTSRERISRNLVGLNKKRKRKDDGDSDVESSDDTEDHGDDNEE